MEGVIFSLQKKVKSKMCGTNHKVKIVFGHCCGGMTCGWAEVGPVV